MKKRSLSMNQIMILSLTAIVVGILGCAIAFFLQTYQRSLIRNAQTDGRRTISQVTSTVDGYLSDMNNVMELLADELVTPSDDREHFFETFLKIRSDVVAVTIYDEAGYLMNCYSLGHEVRPVVRENLSFDRTMLDVYADGYVSAPHVMSLFEGYYPWVVTIIRPVDAGKWEKWVAVDISCTNISSYINGIGIGQRGYCFLEDTNGNIVYHPQQQLIYSDLKQENTALISNLDDGSHVIGTMIYTVQTLSSGSWRVVGVSFVQEIITDNLREIARLLALAAIAIVAATLAVSFLFSRVLSRPIHDLISAMAQFEKNADNFVYEPVSGVREVQDLSSSFAHLVRKIQQLMATVRAEEVNLRKTELRALQAQINPHFLYNTLDSISWMCEQGKNKDAVVLDGRKNIVAPRLDADDNLSLIDQTVDAMVNCVFNDRLERNLVAEVIQTALVDLEAVGELVLVAHRLNLQVALRVLHLVADGDELMALADADAEQLRQRVYHHDRFLVLPPLAHPRNGVERVVEEMRVDLRLQGSELRFAEVHLFGAHGRHQLLDFPHHVRK